MVFIKLDDAWLLHTIVGEVTKLSEMGATILH